jgi:aspartate/tyrosine/aromatic aminotransferase
MSRKITQGGAEIVLKALDDIGILLANWPTDKPEFKARLKQLRRELKAAAKIVASHIETPMLFS